MDKPGLLFITTRGGERFRIVEQTTRPDRLLTAHIALLPEPPVQPVPEALADVLPLLRAIVADAGEEAFPLPHRFDDATWVGYRLAEILPIPVQARQRLLELDDPISRLEIIQAYLRQHKLLGTRGCEKPASPSSRPALALTGSAVPVGSIYSTADSDQRQADD
jgi:Lon protease-like protein